MTGAEGERIDWRMTSEMLLIGGGAGFSGDRTDAAGPVVDDARRARRPAVV